MKKPDTNVLLERIYNNAREVGSCNDAIDRGFEEWAIENGPRFHRIIRDSILALPPKLQQAPEFQQYLHGTGGSWTSLYQAVNRLKLSKRERTDLERLCQAVARARSEETEATRAHALETFEALSQTSRDKLRGVELWLSDRATIGLAIDDLWEMGLSCKPTA